MATKIIVAILCGLILLGSNLAFAPGPNHEQRILQSSLLITMTVPELEAAPQADQGLPIPPDEYKAIAKPKTYKEADGLGTLINTNGELLIITHDHWSVFDSPLGIVQISNGLGQLLVELQMHQFKRLVRSRDGGTMILSAPAELSDHLQPVQLNQLARSSKSWELSAGDRVNLVYRQRSGQPGVAVMQAKVESIGQKAGLPVVRLSTLEGLPLVGGDSGGGVWLDGKLVANIWTTIMKVDSQTGNTLPADSSIAALMNNASG